MFLLCLQPWHPAAACRPCIVLPLLQSAKGMFEHHRVDNVVMEYTPGAWEGNNKWEDYPSVPGMLE